MIWKNCSLIGGKTLPQLSKKDNTKAEKLTGTMQINIDEKQNLLLTLHRLYPVNFFILRVGEKFAGFVLRFYFRYLGLTLSALTDLCQILLNSVEFCVGRRGVADNLFRCRHQFKETDLSAF